MEKTDVIAKDTKREVNMELLRIVGMLMVVTLHCLGNGHLTNNSNMTQYNFLLIRFLDTFALTANAIFLVLSGYYSINKPFKLKRVLSLWGKTIFYSISIYIICKLLNREVAFYESLFPVMTGHYWFISAYIVLAFLSPIINVILNKLNKKQNTYLIVIWLIILGVIRVLINPSNIYSGAILPVIFAYMVGAYIKKYITIKPKQLYFVKYILITVIITFAYIVLSILSNVVKNPYFYVRLSVILTGIREYNSVLGIIMTVLIFMKFKTMTIKSKFLSKLITIISPSVFSVYLLHENVNIRDTLWLNMGIMNYANSWLMIPYILLMIITVFAVCICIDLVRRGAYFGIKKIPMINKLINKINSKLDAISLKLNNYLSETEGV